MNKVCAFFGHREIWQDISTPLEHAIRTAITEHGISTFWVGGYGKFDSCAARCVHRLKKEFPQIMLQLILAYLPTQNTPLNITYDSSIYPEGLEVVPKRFAISKRNQWIVNNCDMAIVYVRNTYGGAYTAYRSAIRKNKLVINLAD